MTPALRVGAWVLAIAALVLFLVAPNANGPLLVLVWAVVLFGFRGIVAGVRERKARLIVGAAFLWVCFIGAFWGGWFLLPAGAAFLAYDWRTEAERLDPRLAGAEVVAAAASALSGFIALALLVAAQPAASTRSGDAGASAAPYDDLASVVVAGPPSDRLDLAVVLVGLLLGLLLFAAVMHAQTSSRLAFICMCVSVLGVATFAALASLSAGWWFVPAVVLGVAACLAGWRRGQRASAELRA